MMNPDNKGGVAYSRAIHETKERKKVGPYDAAVEITIRHGQTTFNESGFADVR